MYFKHPRFLHLNMFLQEMQAHIDKINEMASVMRKAIEVDEGRICEDEERIKQLEVKKKILPFSTFSSQQSQDGQKSPLILDVY